MKNKEEHWTTSAIVILGFALVLIVLSISVWQIWMLKADVERISTALDGGLKNQTTVMKAMKIKKEE